MLRSMDCSCDNQPISVGMVPLRLLDIVIDMTYTSVAVMLHVIPDQPEQGFKFRSQMLLVDCVLSVALYRAINALYSLSSRIGPHDKLSP